MSALQLLSTADAAKYLGLSVATLKYHLYTVKTLAPDGKIGRSLVFTRETLDQFQESKRKPGRPPASDQKL